MIIFFFKQKTAYELRISDWSQTCALPIYSGVAVALEARYGSFVPANTKAFAFQPFVFFDAAWVWNKDAAFDGQIGRAHVRTPVTNAQLVCRLLLDKQTYLDYKKAIARPDLTQI